MLIFTILFFVLVIWLLVRSNSQRGKNFVRSYYFLLCLSEGQSVEESNYLARSILTLKSNPDFDKRLIQMASNFSQENFNGKQLLIIKEAALKGFVK